MSGDLEMAETAAAPLSSAGADAAPTQDHNEATEPREIRGESEKKIEQAESHESARESEKKTEEGEPSETNTQDEGIHSSSSHSDPSSFAQRQSAASPSSPDTSSIPPLPRIDYTLRTRVRAITIFWFLILVDCIAVPIALYFCLERYAPELSENTIFSISTGALGGVSIAEYFIRFWRLWRHNSDCRVVGARRWYLDWFHWNFSIAWIFIMIELIVGTVQTYPPIRLLAMPVSTMLYWFAFEVLLEDVLRYYKVPAPLRISSIPRGEPIRPGIYSVIEDVCAVDGHGGTVFREQLNARYLASHDFRQMLHRLTLFWGIGTLAVAIITTILVFTVPPRVAYVIGWCLPFVWAGFWALATWWYVQKCLKFERSNWTRIKAP